jgi:hypothetical protein
MRGIAFAVASCVGAGVLIRRTPVRVGVESFLERVQRLFSAAKRREEGSQT